MNFKLKTKKTFLVLLAGFALSFSFLTFAHSASAITNAQRCADFRKQFEITGGTNVIADLPSFCTADSLLLKAINLGLLFSGTIAVLFIILGGYFYLTAAGNEEASEKGRKILTNAIIGLIVIMLAVVIVRIVGQTINGSAPTTSSSSSTGGTGSTGNNLTDPGSGSGATGGTGAGSASGPSGNVNGLVDFAVPSQVPASGVYIVRATIKGTDADSFKTACGVMPTDPKAALYVQIDGKYASKFASFSDTGKGFYQAELVMDSVKSTASGQSVVTTEVCGQKWDQNVTYQGVSARSDASVAAAAANLKYYAVWNASNEFTVYIENSSANNSYVSTLCSGMASSDQKIQLQVNGGTAVDDVTGNPYFPISQRIFKIDLADDTATQADMSMTVCGTPLPSQTVTPSN